MQVVKANLNNELIKEQIHQISDIVTLLIVKGAGICSLFHKIHYIKIRYIEVWVYVLCFKSTE